MMLTRLALERNRVTTVALIVVLLAGVGAYLSLPRDQDPGFTIRFAQVLTLFPGASPERVEQLVTEPIEEAIMEMPELWFVSSASKTGASIVVIAVDQSYSEMRPIWDNLRRKVDRARRSLPDGVIGPIVNDEWGDVFGIVLTLTGDGFTNAELKEVADEVREELLLIDEAAKVEIHGALEERIFVEYNNATLARLGLTPTQLLGLLAQRNVIIPGGEVRTDDERIVLEPSGNFESVADLKRTVVQVPRSTEVTYLEDIAEIRRGTVDPPPSRVRCGTSARGDDPAVGGVPCLSIAVSLRAGGNILTLGKAIDKRVTELEGAYPIGIEFDRVFFLPDLVDKSVKRFESSLGQAVLIVLAVMLLFLGIRTGLLVASLVPSAIIMALLFMSVFGIGLDQVSLASLIIALGMLVDNAIVMAESMMVQIRDGTPHFDAALRSSKELWVPLLTSSLTTAAAFLPIYLAESETGEYTAPIFKVVTITLLCSWVLALTLIPLLATKFMKVKAKKRDDVYDSVVYRTYRRILVAMLRHKVVSLLATVAVFMGAMSLFQYVPAIFFPPSPEPFFTASLDMPVGTPIERTEEVVEDLERYVVEELMVDEAHERDEGIINWGTFIGGGEPRFILNHNPANAAPNSAIMLGNTTSGPANEEVMQKLERYANKAHPDLEVTVRPLASGPPVTDPIQIRVSGRKTDEVFAIADRVKALLGEMDGTKNVTDDWGRRTKKLVVKVNQARARRAGVTNQDVAISLQTNLSGLSNTQYREDDKVIPITLRSVVADRSDIGKIESLNVYSSLTGQPVPLKQVADVEVVWQPSVVLRRQGLKTVTVRSQLEPGYNAISATTALAEKLDEEKKAWKPGYKYELGGEIETSGKANASIAEKLPIAFFIILMLLVMQFNSIRRSVIVLCTIPLGLIGVVIGLLAANSYMGFMTFLGIISLAGIVINNAIVLLERINMEIDHGLDPPLAVVKAAQLRFRPILLTTATTMGGMLPLWFSGQMFEPLAIAIIFGLMFSTVMTLGVVPVLFATLFRVKYKNFRYEGGAPAAPTAPPEPEPEPEPEAEPAPA